MFSAKATFLCRRLASLQPQWRSFNNKQLRISSDFFENCTINQKTIDDLEALSKERKSRADIDLVKKLYGNFENEKDVDARGKLESQIRKEMKKFPNKTHPIVLGYGPDSKNVEIGSYGEVKGNPGKDYVALATLLNMIRLQKLGNCTGSRSYYFTHHLAELVS